MTLARNTSQLLSTLAMLKMKVILPGERSVYAASADVANDDDGRPWVDTRSRRRMKHATHIFASTDRPNVSTKSIRHICQVFNDRSAFTCRPDVDMSKLIDRKVR